LLRVGVAGLLHPAAGSEVRRVSRRPSHLLLDVGPNLPFPASRSPFEEFPSSAAVPHHCGRCLLAVSVHPPPGRPSPMRHLHPPKPVEALPVDRLAIHRGGWSVDREEGASCPPTFVRCLPKRVPGGGVPCQRVGCRSNPRRLPKQSELAGTGVREGGVNRHPTSQAEAGSHLHRSEDGAGGPCPVSR
jgi:hypothetical protein